MRTLPKYYKAILEVCKEDLIDAGMDEKKVEALTDEEMQQITDDVMESMQEMQFRCSLEAVIEDLGD